MLAREVLYLPAMTGIDAPQLSVVLLFGNHEDTIGAVVRRIVDTSQAAGLTCEVVAVDHESHDNSHAVLAMLRQQLPMLRVCHAPPRISACEFGASRSNGALVAVAQPACELEGLFAAVARVAAGDADVEVRANEFAVVHRGRAALALVGLRLRGSFAQRRWARHLEKRGLRVMHHGSGLPLLRRAG